MGRLASWVPVVLWLALVFGLSHLSRPLGSVSIGGWDKLAHAGEYAVLGLLLAQALWAPGRSPGALVLVAALLALFWGIGDELHQAYVPGRDASAWDVVADGVGGLAGALAWTAWRRRRDRLLARAAGA